MSGPEHYREAERLINLAHDLADQERQERADFIVARAQVHATLALAAATAETRHHTPQQEWGGTTTYLDNDVAWSEVSR